MKLKMIALLSSGLGVITAVGVHFVGERFLAHHSGNHGIQNQDIAEMMYADPTSPVILKVDPQLGVPHLIAVHLTLIVRSSDLIGVPLNPLHFCG